MNQKQEKDGKKLTLPVSDTVPGPGNFTVKILNMEGDGVPVVNATDLVESLGAGTAKDVSSVLMAPEPGTDS